VSVCLSMSMSVCELNGEIFVLFKTTKIWPILEQKHLLEVVLGGSLSTSDWVYFSFHIFSFTQ
jgi:hypothetical protein